MLLQLQVTLLGDRDLLEDLPGGRPGKALLVRRIGDQRVLLDLCPGVMQKNAHVVLARVVIGIRDVRQPDADVVDQCLVLQRVSDHSHALCEVALLERRSVPGEDKRHIFHLFLLHAVREILQDPIVKAGLFLSVKQLMDVERDIAQVFFIYAVDDLVLLIADAVSGDCIHSVHIRGHECGCHLQIFRIGLQDLLRRLIAVFRELHIAVVIGNSQPLVLGPALHDLQHALNSVLCLVESEGPQAGDDLRTVVGLCHGKRCLPVPHSLADSSKELVRDPVHRIEIADTCPGGDGTLHC